MFSLPRRPIWRKCYVRSRCLRSSVPLPILVRSGLAHQCKTGGGPVPASTLDVMMSSKHLSLVHSQINSAKVLAPFKTQKGRCRATRRKYRFTFDTDSDKVLSLVLVIP